MKDSVRGKIDLEVVQGVHTLLSTYLAETAGKVAEHDARHTFSNSLDLASGQVAWDTVTKFCRDELVQEGILPADVADQMIGVRPGIPEAQA